MFENLNKANWNLLGLSYLKNSINSVNISIGGESVLFRGMCPGGSNMIQWMALHAWVCGQCKLNLVDYNKKAHEFGSEVDM